MMVFSREELIVKMRGEFPHVSYVEFDSDDGGYRQIFVSEVQKESPGWHLNKHAAFAIRRGDGEEVWDVGDWGEFISEGRRRHDASVSECQAMERDE